MPPVPSDLLDESSAPAPRTKWSRASVILLALLAAPPTTPFTRSFDPSPKCPDPVCGLPGDANHVTRYTLC